VLIDPDIGVEAARAGVATAVEAFAAAWNEDEFRRVAQEMTWNADAACAPGAALDSLAMQAQAAVGGDLGAARVLAAALAPAALQRAATTRSAKQKAQVAALLQWPLVQAAERLDSALVRLEQGLRVDCLQYTHAWTGTEKRRRNVLAFDDLLEALHRVLTRQGPQGLLATAIRRQFQAALIDEFQDTDRFQYDIFATAFAGCPLFLIGDPKQAIYAFRGADVHAYLAAVRHADPQFTLVTNYRSTADMVGAVNAVFSQRRHAFVEDAIAFEAATATPATGMLPPLEGDHALHWLFVGPEDRGAKRVVTNVRDARALLFSACVRHVAAQLTAGWKPGDIAVLVRDRHEGVAMAELLRAHRIPAVVSGLGNVVASEEMRDLQLVLEAIATPRHEARVRAAVATRLWGHDADAVRRLSQAGAEAEWDAVLSQFAALRELWVSHGLLQVVQEVVAQREVTERFLAFDDGERRLTNLRHALELVHTAAVDGALNLEGVLQFIRTSRADLSRESEVRELRLETDADAVRIFTIHKSKGLQFDLVYCPTLFSARPTESDGPLLVHEGEAVIFDHSSPVSPERVREAEVERLAEDCRLAYVALTRARYRTYVGWGAVGTTTGKPRGAWNSALGYLLCDLPELDTASVAARPELVAAYYKQNVERYEHVVRALVERYPSLMHLEVVDSVGGVTVVSPAPAAAAAPAFSARTLPDDVPLPTRFDTYTISSFTHLTAGAHAVAPEIAPEVAHDVDDVRTPTMPASPTEALPRSDFRAFPAGRRAGTVLHALFEHARFDDPEARLREQVAVQLLRADLAKDEADPCIDATVRMMQAVFASPMAPWPVTLANVVQEKAHHEWQFLLPFANAANAWTRQAIAQCFERFGGSDGARYAPQLRKLGGARVHGFLTGFVDLVFEHRGQWYVVDWKSNQLGADLAAYERAPLQRVMESSHYVLQYHLYVVALHRYLTIRLPGYDYDRHIGGAGYAFLRGFAAGPTDAGTGWYTDRPSRALIEALSAVMDGRDAGAPG
jgi:exodeoxyribonuclease V beta subunit